MWKANRWLVVIVVVLMLVVGSSQVSAGEPWALILACDPFDNLPMVEQEMWDVMEILEPVFMSIPGGSYNKYNLIWSLKVSEVWHFAGHGSRNWYGKNWLLAGDEAPVYGDDIPPLTVQRWPQSEYDHMTFAFANACHSGIDSFWVWVKTLPDGFIGQGADCYLGWDDAVFDTAAYLYAVTFYDLAITNEWSISTTRTETEDLVGTPGANSLLYGDGSVTLIL